MIFDNNLIFSNNQALTSTTAPSTNVIDLQGGLAINAGIDAATGLAKTNLAEDIGRGDGVAIPKVACFVTTAGVSAGGATLQVQLQGAADTGASEPGGTPDTYTTYAETPAAAYVAADLIAGRKIAAFDWPQVPSGKVLPRYLRLNYVIGTSTFSALKVFAGIVLQRQDNNVGDYPENFVVGP